MLHSTLQMHSDEQITIDTTNFLTSSLDLLDEDYRSFQFCADVMDVMDVMDVNAMTHNDTNYTTPLEPPSPPSPSYTSLLPLPSESLDVEIPLKLVNDQVLAKIGDNWYNLDGELDDDDTQRELTDKADHETNGITNHENENCQNCQTKPENKIITDRSNNCLRQLKKRNVTKNKKRSERLWEFLLRLLRGEDTNPSLIEWVDKDNGMFQINKSKVISEIWGSRKNNSRMTYEKLSRAMRYYYKRQILQPVYGKKLVYQFGPHSTGW